MGKKGMYVWILSTLTFVSLIHTIDAAIALLSSNHAQLPEMYPLLSQYLTQIPIDLYLYTSAAFTIVAWGLTCLLAFDSPIETFLNKTLTDAQLQRDRDEKVLEDNSDFFDLMYQNMEESKKEIGQTCDLVRNLRAEVKDVQKMRETFEEARAELAGLRRQVRMLEEKMIFPMLCNACGKPLRADFSICPYCGKEINVRQQVVVCDANVLR